jgi:hypothetical protein
MPSAAIANCATSRHTRTAAAVLAKTLNPLIFITYLLVRSFIASRDAEF